MSDIVEHLRDVATWHAVDVSTRLFAEAADEIERLRKILQDIHDLEMGRGDGVVGDYIEDIRRLASAAIPAAEGSLAGGEQGTAKP